MIRFAMGLMPVAAILLFLASQFTAVTTRVAGSHFGASGGLHLSAGAAPATPFQIAAEPAAALLSFKNMAPGDQVTAPLLVQNPGAYDFRYSIVALADNADGKGLANQLQLTIKSGVTRCTNAAFKKDGATLYGPAPLGTPAGLAVVGSPEIGPQPGDRILPAGASETLCFNVTLPLNTPNAFQNAKTSATFTLIAEQIGQ